MKLAVKIVFRILLSFIFLGLLLFLPAWSLKYWEAWVYIITLVILIFFIFLYFFKKDPDFLERRILRKREKGKEQESIQWGFSIKR
jgi:Mn2+/Fe2+ NRAMP family transporter